MTAIEMKPAFFAPKGTLDNKPPHGAPCNRCGLCCVGSLCPLGSHLFRRELGPCPALEYMADGRSACGVVAHPARHVSVGRLAMYGIDALRDAALHLIGSSTGCDARFNGEPINKTFHDMLRRLERRTRAKSKRAREMWGM
jgi:hypothetical protein